MPGLLSMGLLRHSEFFALPPGYYRLDSVFILLAFMALARVKTIESLRYCPPGEWGKLLGLDRIPEAKTLRQKVKVLSQRRDAQQWGGALSREWMGMFPESTGALYIDGHVRVYNGSQTELPHHYIARQKLCLRATPDYWVNAMDGQPFFMVNKAVDPGLLAVLEQEIVPRLIQDRFRMLGMQGKYFIDTIKLIAYRAETAMVNIVRQTMRRQDDAPKLVCSLYAMDADLLPDYVQKKLIIQLHQPANRASAETMLNIFHELNATKTFFPGTNLRLVYKLVS